MEILLGQYVNLLSLFTESSSTEKWFMRQQPYWRFFVPRFLKYMYVYVYIIYAYVIVGF